MSLASKERYVVLRTDQLAVGEVGLEPTRLFGT